METEKKTRVVTVPCKRVEKGTIVVDKLVGEGELLLPKFMRMVIQLHSDKTYSLIEVPEDHNLLYLSDGDPISIEVRDEDVVLGWASIDDMIASS